MKGRCITYKAYTVKDIERASRRARAKEQNQNKLNNTKNWYYNNREVILVCGPVVIGAVTTIVKVVIKHVNLKKQNDVKDLYCYDRSLGHYWCLRRRLSNKEWVEIDKRKKNGERLADIFSELKVLK